MNITEVQAEIERLKKTAADAQEQVKSLERLIEEKKPWPKIGGAYYTPITPAWEERGELFAVTAFDRVYLFSGLAHRDLASAQKHKEIIDRMLELRGYWRADWGNENQIKFYIDFTFDGLFDYSTCRTVITQGTFYLPTEEACKTLIEEFGDDLRVLFGMPLKREGDAQ